MSEANGTDRYGQLGPALRILGPLGGFRPGRITTQGDVLARAFAAAGYTVHTASAAPNRIRAMLHIVWTAVRAGRNDILLAQVYSGRAFATTLAVSIVARLLGLRLVLHLHGGDLPKLFARRPGLARFVLRSGAAIVAPSEYLAGEARALGCPARVIPNAIDLEACTHRPRLLARPRLLWMRSFHPLYNPGLALRTLTLVRERVPDATLVMAGADKGMESAMRAEAARLGLGEAVDFAGFLDADGKARAAEACDVFLNTNHVDNTPVSVIEACAFGMPVVATRVAGISVLLDHERTALLVPDDDAEAMAAAVLRLLGEPGTVARLSQAGRRLAERSAWPGVREEWEALFAELGATPVTERRPAAAAPQAELTTGT